MRRNPRYTTTADHQHAQKLRHESSFYEQKLWAALRQNSGVAKLKFRRQQPIHPYIVDFICMKAKFIVELDGMSHDATQAYDEKRDAYLLGQGYTVMRIGNDKITENLSGVVETIILEAQELLKRETPSPAKTKDLPRGKSKFLRPLPQGERN